LTRLVSPVVLSALALAAAGCGGGGSSSSSGDEAGGPVSGTVSVVGMWSGRDRESFEAVAQRFMDANPAVKVEYRYAGPRLAAKLSSAVEAGDPPDIAVLGQPRVMRELARRDALTSLEYMKDDVELNLGESAVVAGSVDGTLYGFIFKASNKSTVWYNVHAFQDAVVAVPDMWTWADLRANAAVLTAAGTPGYSIGGADGWTLADLFDNVYLRQAGLEKYDRLAAHKLPWTDESVKSALRLMAELFKDRENIAGNPLEIGFEESVSNVFASSPQAAMVIEGDFVPAVTDSPSPVPVSWSLTPRADYYVFAFPSIDGSAPMVVGTGDSMVSFNDEPATKAFLRYLTTAEAAEIWATRGGFATLNRDIYPSVYLDVVTRETAGAFSSAEAFRYDLSELQPPAFEARLSELFQDLLAHPGNVDAIATQLEEAAKKAYP
jgi:alpha-glucoside transport system substrate-binding protein